MVFELDRKVLLYWRFTAAVIFAAVFSALWMLLPIGLLPKAVTSVIILVLTLLWWLVYLPLRFKTECVKVDIGRIYCRKGVVVKREYVYPNTRIVYIQTVRLPLAYCFGLFSVVIRGVGHSLILPLMNQKQMTLFLKAVRESE